MKPRSLGLPRLFISPRRSSAIFPSFSRYRFRLSFRANSRDSSVLRVRGSPFLLFELLGRHGQRDLQRSAQQREHCRVLRALPSFLLGGIRFRVGVEAAEEGGGNRGGLELDEAGSAGQAGELIDAELGVDEGAEALKEGEDVALRGLQGKVLCTVRKKRGNGVRMNSVRPSSASPRTRAV